MTRRTCDTCHWWNRHSGLAVGDCQKRPPNSITSKWPSTDGADFCGEWSDKNITPEQAERRELVQQFAVALVASGSQDMIHKIWRQAALFADYEGQV